METSSCLVSQKQCPVSVTVQDKNASKAASMPESKRWIDPAIIQRNWEENEAALKAEEERRRDAAKERNLRMVSALNKQVPAASLL